MPIDAYVADAAAADAEAPDAGPPSYQCNVLSLARADACAIAMTGEVTPCWVDEETGLPSETGSLEVRRHDGTSGYLCAAGWSSNSGPVYDGDLAELFDSPAGCCGGPDGAPVDWPAPDPFFGVAHGPTLIKRWETMTNTGGDVRENPFAVVISSPASAAEYYAARAQWEAWAGDGVPHTGPHGPGEYYFPEWLPINYVVIPTVTGEPLIVIAPEVSRTVSHTRPLGHPTLGACGPTGGAPLAFFGGMIDDTIIDNRSGRFSAESGTTPAHLDNTAALFNCYGITVTGVEYFDPDDYP
jgi:hypothetical protein